MKEMHQEHPIAKLICSMLALVSGTYTYLNIHLGFDPSFWGSFLDRAISILGACIVAGLTGFCGYVGTLLAKKLFKSK